LTAKAILFDLDGTLWDRTSAVRALAYDQHEDLRDVLGHIPRDRYVDRIVRLDDLGRVDKGVLYETIGVEFDLRRSEVARSSFRNARASASQTPKSFIERSQGLRLRSRRRGSLATTRTTMSLALPQSVCGRFGVNVQIGPGQPLRAR